MCGSDAPPPPDPKDTAAAATSSAVGTAISNAFLGNVNQITPDGSLSYDQTGSYTYRDPYTGKSYNIPRFTATQTFSPQQTLINDQNKAAQLNLSQMANQQSSFLKDYLSKPVDIGNEAVESRLWELAQPRLTQSWANDEENIRTRLKNSGIQEGSAAWNSEMQRLTNSQTDARNQLLLTGRGQAVQEQLAERNQPLNEITALMSGSQVSQPNFVPTNMPQIANTDVAGIINQGYQNQLGYAQSQDQNILGGLFSLGASALSNPAIMASDRRVKDDVHRIGETDDGQPLYAYRYKGDDKPQIGLMAQDVERRNPDAVMEIGGVKHVDYSKAIPAMGSILRAA